MRLLDTDIPFRENLLFSLTRYRLWWLILLVTLVFDFVSTLGFVMEHGPSGEANPVVRALMRGLGVAPGVVVGKVLQLLAVVVFAGFHRRLGNLFLLVIVLLNCWAVVINSLQ